MFNDNDIVKSCRKLERGLRFGPEGIRACQVGPYASPIYWNEEEASTLQITKEMIIEQRQRIFMMLNDSFSETACKQCDMVELKKYSEVDFTKLGHIDHAPRTICNLRCNYCGYTHAENRGDLKNGFVETGYDSLKVMSLFSPDDVTWDAFVDYNGGETSLIKNIDEHLRFFKEMRIRVLLYTNAVTFSEPIYKGLSNGSIEWVVTSVDCGTPSTYKATKRADVYTKVIENCARYAHAAEKSHGNFAVKYIFTDDNLGDDDLTGFAYAMLAVRPQRVWLTFDFNPFGEIGGTSDDFGKFNFTSQIEAYAKLFILLSKHGIEPVHYTEGHLATISKAGQKLMELVRREIRARRMSRIMSEFEATTLLLENFRSDLHNSDVSAGTSRITKFRISPTGQLEFISRNDPIELNGKRIVVAPVTQLTRKLCASLATHEAYLIGMMDKSAAIHGKVVDGVKIYDYTAIKDLKPDYIMVAPPVQHLTAILHSVQVNMTDAMELCLLQAE